jgi:hypothetical protein
MTPISVSPVLKAYKDTKKIVVISNSNVSTAATYPTTTVATRLLGRITGPLGQIIANGVAQASALTPNINVTSTESNQYSMDLDEGANIIEGEYKLEYAIGFQLVNADIVNTIAANVGGKGQVVLQGDFSQVLQVGLPITISGATNTSNNGVKTIDSFSLAAGVTTVLTTQLFAANETPTSPARISFERTPTTYTSLFAEYNCEVIKPCSEVTVDCFSTRYGQIKIKNKTVTTGQTVVNKSISISHPADLDPAPETDPITTSNDTLLVNRIASGQWVYTLEYVLRYTTQTGMIVEYTSTLKDDIIVDCASWCSIKSCYDQLLNAHYETGNSAYASYLSTIKSYLTGAYLAQSCGDNVKFQYYIKMAAGVLSNTAVKSDCNCGCSDATAPQWIDNMAGDPNRSIQTLLTDLQVSVGGLQDQLAAVEDSGAALAAWTALINSITALNSAFDQEQADVAAIHAQVLNLNPSSPTFAADLAFVTGQFGNVNFATLTTQAQAIQSTLNSMSTTYAFGNDYYLPALNNITSLLGAITTNSNSWTTYQGYVNSLTASNYATVIADIFDEIETLNTGLQSAYFYISGLQTSVGNIEGSIAYLTDQISIINTTIASLQAQFPIVSSKVQPLWAEAVRNNLNSTPFFAFIPKKYLSKGGYLKIVMSGYNGNAGTENITITNQATGYNIIDVAVADKKFVIELLLKSKNVGVTYSAGGHTTINNNTNEIFDASISATTEIVYDTDTAFIVAATTNALVLTNIEIYGYDETFN